MHPRAARTAGRIRPPPTLDRNPTPVALPTLVDRRDTYSGNPRVGRQTNQTHREFIYRMAYEMGRHIIGYEIQKVLALVDGFTRDPDELPIVVFGYGEGGLLAYYSTAVDDGLTADGLPRIRTVVVSGYFGSRIDASLKPESC